MRNSLSIAFEGFCWQQTQNLLQTQDLWQKYGTLPCTDNRVPANTVFTSAG